MSDSVYELVEQSCQSLTRRIPGYFLTSLTGDTTKKATSTLYLPATNIHPIGEAISMRMTLCCVPWTGSLTMLRYSTLKEKVSVERNWKPLLCRPVE